MKSLIHNLLLLYLLYFLSRMVYLWEFWDIYEAGWQQLNLWQLIWGGVRFDTAIICYTNIPYILMCLLPLSPRVRASRVWRHIAKGLFVTINTLCLWINLVDTVYSRYTGRRTTSSFFSEFAGEGNLDSILFTELLNHWYLVLIGLVFLASLLFLYHDLKPDNRPPKCRLLLGSVATMLALLITFIGMRGGLSYHRPIGLSDANGYVNRPKEANLVLNTPFALIRTIGKTTFTNPHYFSSDQLDTHYSPLHPTVPQSDNGQRNVVILILESFGEEYWGFYNNGHSLTPFLDSLASQSLTFRRNYANGRKSIDALPSILSSIPMFEEPFILTRYANNEIGSIATYLAPQGYRTAFFHGADNASMGFKAYSQSVGFEYYYGMNEYSLDSRFCGKDDFDGTWAIWDEEFLQYFALMLDTMPQPFCTALFTATSHHPFNIPTQYQGKFESGNLPIYQTIRYSDHALRHFFRTASQMPWYDNTLFVITADHTNNGEQEEYNTDLGRFRVPILFFDPSGRLPRGIHPGVMQQIDIMPTLLNLLGCPQPYLAFGIDILNTPPHDSWAVSYTNGIYQYVQGDTLLLFDGQKVTGLYDLVSDPLLQHNHLNTDSRQPSADTLKGIIQSYMQRMIANQLTTDQPFH